MTTWQTIYWLSHNLIFVNKDVRAILVCLKVSSWWLKTSDGCNIIVMVRVMWSCPTLRRNLLCAITVYDYFWCTLQCFPSLGFHFVQRIKRLMINRTNLWWDQFYIWRHRPTVHFVCKTVRGLCCVYCLLVLVVNKLTDQRVVCLVWSNRGYRRLCSNILENL